MLKALLYVLHQVMTSGVSLLIPDGGGGTRKEVTHLLTSYYCVDFCERPEVQIVFFVSVL